MTALGLGLRVETGLRLRMYASLLPLDVRDLHAAVEREAAENPWLELVERSEAGFSADELRTLASGTTLVEHAERQIAAWTAAPAVVAAAQQIVGALDADGYLREDMRTIANLAQVSDADAEQALGLVQRIEPVGLAARSLGERFRIQLDDAGDRDAAAGLAASLTFELEALATEGQAAFARARGIAFDRLATAIDRLRACDPYPAREFAPPPARVYPEIVITRVGTTLEARIDRAHWPDVRLAALEMGRGASPAMREARTRARLVVDALARRHTTLERLAVALIDRQRDYFESSGDVNRLAPLAGRELARDIGCSESTVSRALAARYATTPFGTIAVRTLVVRRPGSLDLTTRAVRECVRDVIDASPGFSDAAVARALRLRGIRLARRTVAKYRREMGLPALRERHP